MPDVPPAGWQDPVVAVLPRKGRAADLEQVVERAWAESNDMKIIEDAPLYAHGRIRGVTRKDGRPLKPAAELAAIPTPTSAGKSANDEPSGEKAATPKEAKK